MKKIGQPRWSARSTSSPDGKYLRVTRMVKPFSYDVPVGSFGSVDEVWDLDGKVMVELDKRPINLGVQDDTQPPPDPAAGPAARRRSSRGAVNWPGAPTARG